MKNLLSRRRRALYARAPLAALALPLVALSLPARAEAAPQYPPFKPVTTWTEISLHQVEAVGDSAFIAARLGDPLKKTTELSLFRIDASGALTKTPQGTATIDYITSAGPAAGWATIAGFDGATQRQYVRRLDQSGKVDPLFDAPYIKGFPPFTYTHMGAFQGTPHAGGMAFRQPPGVVVYNAAGVKTTAASTTAGTTYATMHSCVGKLFVVDPGKQVYLVDGGASTPLVTDGKGTQGTPGCTGKRFFLGTGGGGSLFDSAGQRELVSLPGNGVAGSVELAGGFVYYRADMNTLAWSNGTTSGNKVIDLAAQVSATTHLTVGGKTLFVGSGTIVVTDGTPTGTKKLASPEGDLHAFAQQGSRAFFLFKHQQLEPDPTNLSVWVSDGTASGTVELGTFPDIANIGIGGRPEDYNQLVATTNAVVVTVVKKDVSGRAVTVYRMPIPAASEDGPDGGTGSDDGIGTDGGAGTGERGTPGDPDADGIAASPEDASDSSSDGTGCATAGHPNGRRSSSMTFGCALAMAAVISAARRLRHKR